MEIKDNLILEAGSAENGFRLFDRWLYKWPGREQGLPLEHKRPVLIQMQETLGSFASKDILELGPHEGEVTVAIESFGPKSVTSIEGRPFNFLKCLTIKNFLGLKAQFYLGDFVRYLEETDKRFDVIVCIGVLYHMSDPLNLLSAMAQRTDQIALGTLYYDLPKLRAAAAGGYASWSFVERGEVEGSLGDFRCPLYTHTYGPPVANTHYGHGGLNDEPKMMGHEDITAALKHLGFTIRWSERIDHPNGPHILLTACRE